jgi:hypothetical protein
MYFIITFRISDNYAEACIRIRKPIKSLKMPVNYYYSTDVLKLFKEIIRHMTGKFNQSNPGF